MSAPPLSVTRNATRSTTVTRHAWVPASIFREKPLESVNHNEVICEVNDLKVLLMLVYNSYRQIAIGESNGRYTFNEETPFIEVKMQALYLIESVPSREPSQLLTNS